MNTLNRYSKMTLVALAVGGVCWSQASAQRDCEVCGGDAPPFVPPQGLPLINWPADNPYTNVKAALGRLLFFDPRLSADGTVSCASCHSPQSVFGDGAAVSTGIRAQEGTRNAPTVINSAYNTAQFWDGRADSLEAQALGPIVNPIEMGTTHHAVVDRLRKIERYRDLMMLSFGREDFTIAEVAKAIATFERTVLSGNSAFDRYQAGDKRALTEQQVKGMDLFFGKANCFRCHGGPLFTDGRFRNIGIGTDKPNPDPGRYNVTLAARDWAAFKTPGLRDIASTAPYMHDGSLNTLDEVVDLYIKGGIPNVNLNARLRAVVLDPDEKKSLVAFLRALSGDGWRCITPPEKLPE